MTGDKLMPFANELTVRNGCGFSSVWRKLISFFAFQLEMALVYDSLAALHRAVLDLTYKDETFDLKKNSSKNNEYLTLTVDSLECKNFLKNRKNIGQLLHKLLRHVQFDGFTGNVEFGGGSHRTNYRIDIVQMTTSSEMTAVSAF